MTERRQSLQLINFYLLFLQKMIGVAGGRYATEIYLFLSRYQPFVFHRKPNCRPMNKMRKIKREGQETQQMLRERFLDLLLTGLVPYPFFPEGSSIVGHTDRWLSPWIAREMRLKSAITIARVKSPLHNPCARYYNFFCC